MKQLSLLSLVFLFFQVLSLQGQDYQIGEWDIMTIGYANPSADYFDSGVLFGSEPRVNLSNNFALGLRGELIFFSGSIDEDELDFDAALSFKLFGDLILLNNKNRRVFIGGGFGYFGQGSTRITDINGQTITDSNGVSSLGVSPRLGIKLGVFKIVGTYNIALKEEASNYLGIGLSLSLGGQYKDGIGK